jgi:vWA-MoxR associated protein C-terminal domain/Trypsin-like peptidase domain
MAVFVREHSIVGIEGSGGGFVGCGFAVTPRHILTCAHVVNAALGRTGDAAKPWPVEEILVSFPFLPDSSLRAKVVYWKPPIHDVQTLPDRYLGEEEDIAGLELLDSLTTDIEPFKFKPAIAESLVNLFGYPQKALSGEVATGKIGINNIPFGWVEINNASASEAFLVEGGYSGTAVYDSQANDICYGMVVAAGKARGERGKIAYMLPFKELESAIATLQLLEALSFPHENPEDLPKIYRAAYQPCCPPDWHLDRPYPELLSEIVSELQEMGDSAITIAGKSVSSILEFAARLAIHPDMPAAAILRWGQVRLPEFVELMDHLRLAKAAREAGQRDEDPCLIFEVSSDQAPYRTRAFWLPDARSYDPEDKQTYEEVLCWDLNPEDKQTYEEVLCWDLNKKKTIADLPDCSLAELPNRLSGYFKTCVERDRLTDRLRLEVLLPLSLMDQPIELWSLNHNRYSPTIPASEFQVVVRCSERTTRPYRKDCLTKWQAHWDKVQNHLNAQSNPCMVGVAPSAKAPQLKAYYQMPSIVGFKLNDVPQRKFFEALLGAAAPVAVWLRQSPNQTTDDDRSLLQWLEDFLQCSVGQLPHEALRVRAEAIAHAETPEDDNFMIGHHLSLLWENPKLLPPLATKTISQSL